MSAALRVLVEGVGKRYVKFDDEAMLATRRARLWSRTRKTHHWAVRGVDVRVEAGECLGLIGRNGSGKSTLLRMIAGVTAPTEGRVEVRGRVAPLIAVGVGFHPELTGRENVYVNGSVLGVPRKVIDQRFDDIVEFAGIEQFIDTPVKFYSSGMFVRLGFGVSMFADPDVLLVDEVLAVGDIGFQMQCFDRMAEARERGTAIIVVSHNLNAIRTLCRETVLLENGTTRYHGPTAEAISQFHEVLGEARELDDAAGRAVHAAETIVPMVEVRGVEMLDANGAPTRHANAGDEVTFVLDAHFVERVVDPVIAIHLANDRGVQVYGDSTLGDRTGTFEAGTDARFTLRAPLRLASGSFSVRFDAMTADGVICVQPHRPLTFFVAGRNTAWGIADLDGRFSVATETGEGPRR